MLSAFVGGPMLGFVLGIVYAFVYSMIFGFKSEVYCNHYISAGVGLLLAICYHFKIEKVSFAPFVAFMLNFVIMFELLLGMLPGLLPLALYIVAYPLTFFLYEKALKRLEPKEESCACNSEP
jgi:hypothetical protein